MHTTTVDRIQSDMSDWEQCGEDELVRQVQGGTKEAFREIVRLNRSYVFSIIMRQVGDRATAEELAQEVFLKAYRALPRFRQDASLKTWLTRIIMNHTRSYFVSKKYRYRQQTESFDADIHDYGEESAADPVERRSIVASLRICFSKLKGNSQSVISICGFQQQSYQEAADLLQIPVGTVRSRLHKARLELQECLEKRGIEVSS